MAFWSKCLFQRREGVYDGWLLVIDECLSEPLYGTVLYGMVVLGMNGPLMW